MKSFSLSQGTRAEKIGSEMIIYHQNGNVYVANETAMLILESILAGKNAAEAIGRLYEASDVLVQHDVEYCLEVLLEKGVICVRDQA